MRILLTGPTGQIGWELHRRLPALGEVVALGRADLDLSRPETIRGAVEAVRPDLIINAAAYTAVDRAESEPELASIVNGRSPGALAEAAAAVDAAIIHYSTDYVFDGEATRPYRPDDPPSPINAYGRSKLDGELAVQASGARALILRTSWVYSARRTNFLCSVLRQVEAGRPLRVVNDQRGCPTPATVVAAATVELLEVQRERGVKLAEGGATIDHVACRGETSWYEVARAILDIVDPRPRPSLTPVATAEFPTAARRPAYSALDVSGLERGFDLKLPDWQAALEGVLGDASVGSGCSTTEGT